MLREFSFESRDDGLADIWGVSKNVLYTPGWDEISVESAGYSRTC